MAQLVAVFEPIVPMLSGNLVRVSIYGSTVNPFIAAVGAFRFFFQFFHVTFCLGRASDRRSFSAAGNI